MFAMDKPKFALGQEVWWQFEGLWFGFTIGRITTTSALSPEDRRWFYVPETDDIEVPEDELLTAEEYEAREAAA